MNRTRTNGVDAPASIVEKQSNLKSWKPGQSGNPAGRPKGSRNKLGEAFVQALADDFSENGVAAVEKVRQSDPSTYLKIIGNTLPREVLQLAMTMNANFDMSAMEDAQGFFEAYRYARQRIGAEPPTIDLDKSLNAEAEVSWRIDDED